MRHVDTLQQLISKHMEAFTNLYGHDVKPKAHHLFHVVDGMRWLGKLLACFVTERKHREVKQSALHIFRHMEHTVLVDVLNKSFEQVFCANHVYVYTLYVHMYICVCSYTCIYIHTLVCAYKPIHILDCVFGKLQALSLYPIYIHMCVRVPCTYR
jgi:hypothetical protein